jgi:hypothetical protein
MGKILALFLFAASAHASSNLVSGNGYGYVSVDPQSGGLTRFWAHPYIYERKIPGIKDGGVKTANFLKRASWQVNGADVGGPAAYKTQSHVIESAKQSFFMPAGLSRNAVIATSPSGGCLNLDWQNKIKSSRDKTIDGRKVRIVQFKGVKESVMLVPLHEGASIAGQNCVSGSDGFAIMSLDKTSDAEAALKDLLKWQKAASPNELAGREARDAEDWRGSPSVCFKNEDERKLYRQSESILRMAQIKETKGRAAGLINASVDGEFVIPFVRDQAYSTAALSASGHREEARRSLDALLNAGPMGKNKRLARGHDYQISTVRYFGDGSEEADYSGEDDPNFELDSWGIALWSAGDYYEKFKDKAWLNSPTRRGKSAYENMRDHVVHPLLGNLDEWPKGNKNSLIVAKDTSSWEQNGDDYRHYAFSTIAAIGGLKKFLPMAEAMGDKKTVAQLKEKIAALQNGFKAAYVRGNQLRGSLETSPRNEMDGALLEAINMGVIDDPALINSTISRMKTLLMPTGGYRRVTGDSWYDSQEFLLMNFNLARALMRRGRQAEADEIVARMVEKSKADSNIIPELYHTSDGEEHRDTPGAPAGARPMAGYGAGAFMLYMAERQQISGQPASNCPVPAKVPGAARTAH